MTTTAYINEECPRCHGSGEFEITIKDIVTTDMALDAGDKNLAGEVTYSRYFEQCNYCQGLGFVISTRTGADS